VRERPPEPIEPPDNKGVSRPELVEHLIQGRAAGELATETVVSPHAVAAGPLERVLLELGVLVGGRDAGVAEQMTVLGFWHGIVLLSIGRNSGSGRYFRPRFCPRVSPTVSALHDRRRYPGA
jgi:hypothetical protein